MTTGGYGWKVATNPDDVANFLGGCGPYGQPPEEAKVTGLWNGTSCVFHIFYQLGDGGAMPASWGWKVAPDPNDAMNFLNGTGAYCQPVKDARVVSVWREDHPEFYVFYTFELMPARIVDCQVLEIAPAAVGFARLCLGWTYCNGERPQKLAISIFRSHGSGWVNIMPDQQPCHVAHAESATQVDVMVLRLSKGPHKIVFQATYADHEDLEYTFDRLL